MLLKGALNEPVVQRLGSMENTWRGPNMDMGNRKEIFYLGIERHKIALRSHITIPPYNQVWDKLKTKMGDLILMNWRHYLYKRGQVSPANGIFEGVPNQLFEILISTFIAVEKEILKDIGLSYAFKGLAICLIVACIMAVDIREFLNLLLNKVTTASTQQPQSRVTNLSFVAPDEKISGSKQIS